MNSSNSISKAVRYALVVGAASAISAPAVFAQQAPAASTSTAPSTAQLGKIEVTGTRIKRTDVETAQPVTIITAAEIKATGLQSVGDILQNISSAGASLNTQFNNGGNGQTQISLRNLGSVRTLVLINGQRVDAGLGGAVDLNNIPVSVVDHIEVLQDGASAIYGSDAIAGVINIITIKNFNGAQANAYLGMFDGHADGGGWDGKTQEYDFTIGSNTDRSGVIFNAMYVNQSPIYAGNRTISKEPYIGGGQASGSSFAATGRFIMITPGDNSNVNGCSFLAGYGTPSGESICSFTQANPANNNPSLSSFKAWSNASRFNYAPLNYLVTPSERTSLFIQGHYDLADNLTFNTMGVFTNRVSQQQLAPTTIAIGAGGYTSNGALIGISASNPYNPWGKDIVPNSSTCAKGTTCTTSTGATYQGNAPACFTAGTCDELAFGYRRGLETGNRVFNQNVDSFSFRGGFNGYFNMLGSEWDWDANYNYGNNYETDITDGQVNNSNLALALGPAYLPTGAANIPSNYLCGTPTNPIPGCVPFNFFGGYNVATGQGSITPAMAQWVAYQDHAVMKETMRDYTTNITGSLFDLPAGPLQIAAGLEYLEHDGYSFPDATTASGNSTGNVTEATQGRESTNAEYFELSIPLVADAPFMKSVSLDIANRWSQFKWEGGNSGTTNAGVQQTASNSSARAALRWQATDSLLMRGSWSQGFRIPSISEFFFGNSDSYPSLSDPCVSPSAPTVGCGGSTSQPNGQIKSTVGGNPSLTPERSISRSVGFVYSPGWFPGFDFSADYYKIDVVNAISALPAQTILNGCYYGGNAGYCSLITRTGGGSGANGFITDVVDTNINIGGIKTEGVDVNADYKFPSTSIGDFKASLNVTFLKQYVETIAYGTGAPGSPILSSQELAGTTNGLAGGGATGGFPKQRANFALNWNYGDWSAVWNLSYISGMMEDCASSANLYPQLLPRCPLTGSYPFTSGGDPLNHIGATTYQDIAGTYHLDAWNTDFTIGIRNLWDKEPPIAMSSFANSFLPTYYRAPGRFFYGRVTVNF